MIMEYVALVLSIHESVEAEVVLLIGSVEAKCFISYSPSKIEVGKQYKVEFEMMLPDKPLVILSEETTQAIEMMGGGFSCVLSGYLDNDVFRSFVDFYDQDIHYDYPDLNKQYVKIAVDRIDVSFD
ncbi:hypothetical protein [Pseudomonas sp. NFX15]|uniref:hypothetical protein n=1 Tax=Pseudomonas sp. NFX15 TaxID=2816958 RepID=UPI003B8E15E9